VKKLITLFIVLAVILTLFALSSIKVRTVCKSQFGNCPTEIEGEINSRSGEKLYVVKTELAKVLRNNSQVSDFSFQFKLPNRLEVNLLILKPEFAILNKNTGKTYLVDRSGKVIGESASSLLPTIIQLDDTVNIFSLNIVKGIYDMYGVSKGEIVDSSLVIELPGAVKVIFPVRGEDYQVLLGSLRLIYTKITATESVGKYSEIDLRFKNPVLR